MSRGPTQLYPAALRVWVRQETRDALIALAHDSHRRLSDVIRSALDDYVEDHDAQGSKVQRTPREAQPSR